MFAFVLIIIKMGQLTYPRYATWQREYFTACAIISTVIRRNMPKDALETPKMGVKEQPNDGHIAMVTIATATKRYRLIATATDR